MSIDFVELEDSVVAVCFPGAESHTWLLISENSGVDLGAIAELFTYSEFYRLDKVSVVSIQVFFDSYGRPTTVSDSQEKADKATNFLRKLYRQPSEMLIPDTVMSGDLRAISRYWT